MIPQFIDITHWDVSAVVLVLMLSTKWGPSNNQNLTDGQTEIVNLIVGLVTCNQPNKMN